MTQPTTASTPSRRAMLGCSTVILLVGAVILGALAVIYLNNARFVASALPATGQVVELVPQRSANFEGGDIYNTVVEFNADGQTYRFQSAYSTTPDHAVGEPVAIVYDPAQPTHAELADRTNLLTNPIWLGFGVAGVLLALFGLNALVRTARGK